jgi:hypothetical protein
MSVSLLVPGAGDALDVGESLLEGLLAGRGQAGLAEHGGQVGFFGEPGRGVGGGDGGVAAAGGVAGADERGLAALGGREGVLALGLGGVPQAVVDGAEVQVGELVAEQGDLGPGVGVLGVQGRGAAEGGVDLVEPGVQACGAGADRDDAAVAAGVQEVGQAPGGGQFELAAEFVRPGGVGGRVAGVAALARARRAACLSCRPRAISESGSCPVMIDMVRRNMCGRTRPAGMGCRPRRWLAVLMWAMNRSMSWRAAMPRRPLRILPAGFAGGGLRVAKMWVGWADRRSATAIACATGSVIHHRSWGRAGSSLVLCEVTAGDP